MQRPTTVTGVNPILAQQLGADSSVPKDAPGTAALIVSNLLTTQTVNSWVKQGIAATDKVGPPGTFPGRVVNGTVGYVAVTVVQNGQIVQYLLDGVGTNRYGQSPLLTAWYIVVAKRVVSTAAEVAAMTPEQIDRVLEDHRTLSSVLDFKEAVKASQASPAKDISFTIKGSNGHEYKIVVQGKMPDAQKQLVAEAAVRGAVNIDKVAHILALGQGKFKAVFGSSVLASGRLANGPASTFAQVRGNFARTNTALKTGPIVINYVSASDIPALEEKFPRADISSERSAFTEMNRFTYNGSGPIYLYERDLSGPRVVDDIMHEFGRRWGKQYETGGALSNTFRVWDTDDWDSLNSSIIANYSKF